MLALTAHGLASCPQSSLSHYAAVVKRELNIPDDMRLLFGLSFGYEDPDHPSNLVRTSRLPIEEAVAFTRRSEEHTSELQSLMRISYAVFCLKKKKTKQINTRYTLLIHNYKCHQHATDTTHADL